MKYDRERLNPERQPEPFQDDFNMNNRGGSKAEKTIRRVLCILLLLSPFLIYLWSIRPIYHNNFDGYRIVTLRGDIALMRSETNARIVRGQRQYQYREMLVNIETGRQIRLTLLPWRDLRVMSLMSDERVVVRNQRNNEFAVLEINTRRQIVPFGAYGRFWMSNYRLIIVISDGYAGVVDSWTGEELLAPNYFHNVRFIHATDRFVTVHRRADNFSLRAADNIGQDVEHVWAAFCLKNNELLSDFSYGHFMSYQDGMIVLRQQDTARLFDIDTRQDVIPSGQFILIFTVGYGMVEVMDRAGRNTHSALLDLETGYFLADFGRFDGFFRAISSDEIRVTRTMDDGSRRTGTFNIAAMRATGLIGTDVSHDFDYLDSLTVVWDDE